MNLERLWGKINAKRREEKLMQSARKPATLYSSKKITWSKDRARQDKNVYVYELLPIQLWICGWTWKALHFWSSCSLTEFEQFYKKNGQNCSVHMFRADRSIHTDSRLYLLPKLHLLNTDVEGVYIIIINNIKNYFTMF